MNYLNLQSNHLSGDIPSSFGKKLQFLRLGNNNLSGTIPTSLASMPNLYTLDLSSNLLSGSIPSLVSLTSLHELFLSNNLLTGPVPKLSSSITSCELSNNTDLCGQKEISNVCSVGLEACNMDCIMMNEWLPKMFDDKTCCSQSGIGCIKDRIKNLYVYF
jgi:hypothetical protein